MVKKLKVLVKDAVAPAGEVLLLSELEFWAAYLYWRVEGGDPHMLLRAAQGKAKPTTEENREWLMKLERQTMERCSQLADKGKVALQWLSDKWSAIETLEDNNNTEAAKKELELFLKGLTRYEQICNDYGKGAGHPIWQEGISYAGEEEPR